ncbi:MAG: ComEC/Rec2 family competence protein [Actinomycetota bacterium]
MNAAPVFVLAICFATGVLVTDAWAPALRTCTACGAAAGLLCVLGARVKADVKRGVCVAVAMLLLACCLTGLRLQSLRQSALARGGREHADVQMRGQVLDRPQSGGQQMRFTMGVTSAVIDGHGASVRERVSVSIRPPPSSQIEPGDRIAIDGRLASIRQGPFRKERDLAAKMRHAGIASRAFAHPERMRRIGRTSNPLGGLATVAQSSVEQMAAGLPVRERGLFLGVMLGDKAKMDAGTKEEFRATGLSHLVAVDGLKFAIFLGAIVFLLYALRAGPRLSVALTGVAALAFMAMTRFEPSVVRAGAMAGLALVVRAFGAKGSGLRTLGIACLVLMVWDPFLIYNVGFQLSALGTAGILKMAPRLRTTLGGGRFAAAAAVTLGAQLAVNPLIVLTFHQASLSAVPANILAVPAVIPPTVLGLIGAPLRALWSPLGSICAMLSYPFLRWIEFVGRVFARLPGSSFTTPAGPLALIAIGLSLLAIVVAMRMQRFRWAPLAIAGMLAFSVTTWAGAFAPALPAGLRIIGLKVGYGDAVLIQEPHGHTVLVDGGPDENALVKELQRHDVKRIDVMVLTHPHADHVTGLIGALHQVSVGREIDAGMPFGPKMSPRYPGYLKLLEQKHVRRSVVRAGARFDAGDVHLQVLGPAALFEGTDSDPNNNSVVLRLSYHGTCALLTGDVQKEAQEVLLQHPGALSCPILKAPHHGSAKVLREFYAATRARVAIICVGPNDYGHPSPRPLKWLREMRATAYRTDVNGDVTVTIGIDGTITALTQNRNTGSN